MLIQICTHKQTQALEGWGARVMYGATMAGLPVGLTAGTPDVGPREVELKVRVLACFSLIACMYRVLDSSN